MRLSFRVSEPERVALARFQLRHRAREVRALQTSPVRIGIRMCNRRLIVAQFDMFMSSPVAVVSKVGRNAKEIVLTMRFTFVYGSRSKKAVVGFLQKIIR